MVLAEQIRMFLLQEETFGLLHHLQQQERRLCRVIVTDLILSDYKQLNRTVRMITLYYYIHLL